MATVELTAENFEKTISEGDIVMVDFWAEWCGPCKRFGPIFEKASEATEGVVFGKLDTDAHQDLSAGLEIASIPTIMGFREGILVFNQAGAINGSQLDQVVNAIKELDMDEVRAQVTEAKQAHDHS